MAVLMAVFIQSVSTLNSEHENKAFLYFSVASQEHKK